MWLPFVLLWLAACSMGSDVDNTLEAETVVEVESLLAKDPNLPRLTRGEILSLISEIRQGKDVMIVLPQNVTTTTTPKPTRKTVKRRRKPIRPVYRHSTTTGKPAEPGPESSSESPPIFVTPESSTDSYKTSTASPRSTTAGYKTSTASSTPTTAIYKTPTVSPSGSPPDISAAAESLGPGMKQLLNSFGLLGPVSTTEKATYQGNISPTVDPSSYSRFKPLPLASAGMTPEMKSFLSSYGLLDNRRSKAVDIDPVAQLPGKEVLEDLGVVQGRNYIFNPRHLKNSTGELEKVNEILTKLRQISEGNATDLSVEEVRELLALENGTRLAEQQNVDPLADDFALQEAKNEIKRQQPGSTTTEQGELAETTTSVDVETLAAGDSGADLEESFGGTGDTTTAKPNGFYFLLDWNSFIDVGTEDEPRKVNINFSPKVGDPRNFVSVQIP